MHWDSVVNFETIWSTKLSDFFGVDVITTITSDVNAGANEIPIADTTGWVDRAGIIIIDKDSVYEERLHYSGVDISNKKVLLTEPTSIAHNAGISVSPMNMVLDATSVGGKYLNEAEYANLVNVEVSVNYNWVKSMSFYGGYARQEGAGIVLHYLPNVGFYYLEAAVIRDRQTDVGFNIWKYSYTESSFTRLAYSRRSIAHQLSSNTLLKAVYYEKNITLYKDEEPMLSVQDGEPIAYGYTGLMKGIYAGSYETLFDNFVVEVITT